MDYEPDREPGKEAQAERRYQAADDTLLFAYERWADGWEDDDITIPDNMEDAYQDALEIVRDHAITVEDTEEILPAYDMAEGPYRGLFASAAINESDNDTVHYSPAVTDMIDCLGYRLPGDRTLIVDCPNHGTGIRSEGIIVNDSDEAGHVGQMPRGPVINRGTVDTLGFAGMGNLINLGTAEQITFDKHDNLINGGDVEQYLPGHNMDPAIDRDLPEDGTIITLSEDDEAKKGSASILGDTTVLTGEDRDDAEQLLDRLEEASRHDEFRDALEDWNRSHPRWAIDGL